MKCKICKTDKDNAMHLFGHHPFVPNEEVVDLPEFTDVVKPGDQPKLEPVDLRSRADKARDAEHAYGNHKLCKDHNEESALKIEMTELDLVRKDLAHVVETLRKFHVPGGEQYDENNPVDAAYLAQHLETLLRKISPKESK